MSARQMKWVYLLGGDEGLAHYLIESLMEDDPEELGRVLQQEAEEAEKEALAKEAGPHNEVSLPVDQENLNDMESLERDFMLGYDALLDQARLDRLLYYPEGRAFLQRLNIPYADAHLSLQ